MSSRWRWIGKTLTLKGEEGLYFLAVWTEGEYSYAASLSAPVSADSWKSLVLEVTEAEGMVSAVPEKIGSTSAAELPQLEILGILAYDKELQAYIGMAFLPNTVSRPQAQAIARSIFLSPAQ